MITIKNILPIALKTTIKKCQGTQRESYFSVSILGRDISFIFYLVFVRYKAFFLRRVPQKK